HRLSLAVRPLMHLSVKTFNILLRMVIDWSTLYAMVGIITLSSSWPACTARATAVSLPTTWNETIAASSGITGLILPGMIEDPGCRPGRLISAKPVFGPEDSRRRSLERRMTSSARLRKDDDTIAMQAFDCMAQRMSAAGVSFWPETRARLAIARSR